MKIKKIIPLLALLFAAFLFMQKSCQKNIFNDNDCPDYELPEATQSGENTIGCLVDGIVLVPKVDWGWSMPTTKHFKYNEEKGEMFFDISFLAEEKDYECGYQKMTMLFAADSIFGEKEVEADKYSATTMITPNGDRKTYHYRSFMTGISSKLKIIKLDTTKNIISGNFSFEAYWGTLDDYDPDDKIDVTEGRFDFNYRQDGGYVTGYSNDD